MLIIFGGLPASGKTTIARELARQIGAVHVRIDSIEQALRDSGALRQPLNDAGYRAGCAIAEDNLRLGHAVVADSVNPLSITRDAWTAVAKRTAVPFLEIEVQCSNKKEHRRRVQTRVPEIKGLRLPTWEEVISREYQPWGREHLVIDTALCSVAEAIRTIRHKLRKASRGRTRKG